MTAEIYRFDITRTDKASDLHHLTAEINGDTTLSGEEKAALIGLIRTKFSTLNAQALAHQKPRW